MRTSRLSQDTHQVISALQSDGKSTRRSLRGLSRNVNNISPTPEKGASRRYATNGYTSSTSTDDHTTDANSAAFSNRGTPLGKRKRSVADNATSTSKSEATPIRRSPRKDPSTSIDNSPSSVLRKPPRQPAKRIKGPNGTVTIEPPSNWERVYNTTAAQRKRVLAPVDTMGCESLAETHRSPKDQRLQTLVSLMLSSQTKDTVTAAAMKRLQEGLPGGFTLQSLLEVQPEKLNELIEKVGFHNNKTKFIKAVAEILRDQYEGDIPDTIEGLVGLPGVGPKMAYLCMSAAWGRDEGIGVDVHVHRITNLWGWHKTSTPEQTRAELEAWLPKDKWHDINHLLVGFGQTVCLPVGRKCGECDLSAEGLCPSAEVRKSPIKKKVKREVEVKLEDGDDATVKAHEIVVETDDVGVKIEADLEDGGQIEAIDDEVEEALAHPR